MATTPILSNLSLECLLALQDVGYHMVASLTLVIWDFCLTMEDEMEYIWSMRSCVFKWFYLYLRYFPLVSQIVHQVVFGNLSSGNLADNLCTLWFQYMVLTLQVSSFMVAFVLATRVFALFNRSRRVGLFLGCLILADVVTAGVSIARSHIITYFETCLLARPRRDISMLQGVVFLTVQSTMVGMTLFKHFVGTRAGWGRTPLVSFLVRDATSTYVAVFLFCGVALSMCGLNDQRSVIAFFWSVSLFSVTGSRLILNMERFSKRAFSAPDRSILLTTQISI